MSESTAATSVQLASDVEPTPPSILRRYQENTNWRLYEKEWIYRNYPPAGKTWLDFGCGTGEITTQLALLGARHVVGVDVTPGLLDLARRRAELDQVGDRVELHCGRIEALPVQQVDVVLSYAVLHHLPDQLHLAIPQLAKWLAPGGVFIAVEPFSHAEWLEWLRRHSGVPFDPLDEGERKLTPTDLAAMAAQFPAGSRTVPFHLCNRLRRLLPLEKTLRRLDRILLTLPLASRFAGVIVFVGHK